MPRKKKKKARAAAPVAAAKKKKKTPANATKTAKKVKTKRSAKTVVKNALPDLVKGLFIIAAPIGQYMDAAASLTDDYSRIMKYDSKKDAQLVLDGLQKALADGDPVVEPMLGAATVEPMKAFFGTDYAVNVDTGAVISTLRKAADCVSFKAAVKVAKDALKEKATVARQERKAAQEAFELKMQAEQDDWETRQSALLDVEYLFEQKLETFTARMATYG